MGTRPPVIDLQLSPARCSWREFRTAALASEDAGFGTIWVLDHLSGAPFGGHTMAECFTVLGALANCTTRIGLGSLVANVNNRHDGLLALSAATVQDMSAGRFTLGLGAGASPTSAFASEFHALGIPVAAKLAHRHARLVSTLDFLDRHWPDAQHPRDERLTGFARPDAKPPVILGVNSTSLAAIAGGRTNGVNVRGSHPDLAAILDAARSARAALASDTSWTTSVWLAWDEGLLDPAHPTRNELATLGVDRIILSWFPPPDVAAIAGAARWLR